MFFLQEMLTIIDSKRWRQCLWLFCWGHDLFSLHDQGYLVFLEDRQKMSKMQSTDFIEVNKKQRSNSSNVSCCVRDWHYRCIGSRMLNEKN